jgi:hypothetical protein
VVGPSAITRRAPRGAGVWDRSRHIQTSFSVEREQTVE